MAEYVRNHLSSRCYLDGFVDESGRLAVVSVCEGGPRPRLAKPAAVAYRNKFWGDNEELRRQVEQKLSDVEAEAGAALASAAANWPLPISSPERVPLMQFLAIHLLRTPGWRQLVVQLGERWVVEHGDEVRDRWSYSEMIATARSDYFVASLMIEQVPVLASMLGSMHWSLVRFGDPWLITGDQPMIADPFAPGGPQEVSAFPAVGLLHTLEFRFAVDPYHLLLLTWVDRPDLTEPHVGTVHIASAANASVRAQADAEWFHRPGATTPLGTVLLGTSDGGPTAIGPTVLAPYSIGHAMRSRRRREAERHVHDLIEGGVTDEMRTVVVREPSPPAT